MSVFTLIKLVAAVVVVVVLACTSMLAWHVAVEPLGGIFEKLIPAHAGVGNKMDEREVVRTLQEADIPEVDPAAQPYAKARELLAMGNVSGARERFAALINSFPSSPTAPLARQVLGGMNLDDLLTTQPMEGKSLYRVGSGDSYLGIVARQQTTMENLFHINAMMEMKGLRPGDQLVVMPLNFRILIEPRQRVISLWDGGKFICEFAMMEAPGVMERAAGTTVVLSKSAEVAGRKVLPGGKGYCTATKVVSLKHPAARIMGWDGEGEEPTGAILLKGQDMEELNLLVREGNSVEIR